jgi:hypothetical protein
MMSVLRKICLFIGLVFTTGIVLFGQPYFETRRLSFNTSSARELAPAFYKNGLVFCSDRKKDIFPTNIDTKNNWFTNLYRVEQKKPGKFDNPQPFSRELTTYLHEGPSCFSRDGNTIYYTRTIDVSSGSRNRQRVDTTFGIFSADLVNGSWTNITPFRFNRTDSKTGYPFVSDDGSQLFFCSDNPDGFGGYDIYICNWENGHWGQPKNLGKNVNTSKNEVFPFLHSSGRLYFASRGHNQRGDLDIYFTVNLGGTWQKPVSLEVPFNSTNDDYGLIMNTAMDTGYFVSDRAGTADIFAAHSTFPTFTGCKQQEENDYCFVFYEPNNNELDTTAFAYEWDLGDGTKIRKLKAEHCFTKPGTYLVQLNVVDKLTKEVAMSQASDSFLVEDVEQPFITSSDTVFAGRDQQMSGQKTFLKNFEIKEYYWDFGDGYRSGGMETRHSFNYPGTFEVQLGVTGGSGNPKEAVQKKCSIRRIVVMPPPE